MGDGGARLHEWMVGMADFRERGDTASADAEVLRELSSGQDARQPGTSPDTGCSHGSRRRSRRQREVVSAFLAASRHGGFEALLEALDPDIILRACCAAAQTGASREVRGAPAVADTFPRRARFAQPALVNGAAGAVWAPGGRPRVVFGFTLRRGKIVEIDLVADPRGLRQLDLMTLDD